MSQRKFISAKLNINENIWEQDYHRLIQLIPKAIQKKPIYKKGPWTWTFAEVSTTDDGLLFGYLSKSRNESKKSLDLASRTFVEYEVPNLVYASFFVYDPQNEIILFEESSKIERETFLKMFAHLIYQADASIGQLVIIPIPQKEEVYNKIKSIEIITKLEFDIIPPNMIGKKELGDMKKLIQEANATRVKYVLENNKGINKDAPYVDSCIELVANAYGDVKVYGYNERPSRTKKGKPTVKKEQKKYLSRNSVIHQFVKSLNPSEILNELSTLLLRAKKAVRGGEINENSQSQEERKSND